MTSDPAGTREPEVTATLIRLADSLIEDFGLVDVLDELARDCVRLLGVTASAILLAAATGELHVMAAASEQTRVTNCGSGTPLLAGKVTGFEVSYRSSLYYYQNASGQDPQAGMTSWYDLDSAGPPVGNDDGALGLPELQYIDSVDVAMTMSENGHTEKFQTEISLRNVHPND